MVMKLNYFSVNVALATLLAIHPPFVWGQDKPADPPKQSSGPAMLSSNPPKMAPLSFGDVGFTIQLPEVQQLRLTLGFTNRQLQAERLQQSEAQLAQVCAAILGEMKLDTQRWTCHQDGTVKRALADSPQQVAPPAATAPTTATAATPAEKGKEPPKK